MPIEGIVVKTTLILLLSGLIVGVIAGLLELRLAGKKLYEILLGRKRTTYVFFILLILLVPIVFSSLRGAWLSRAVFSAYLRELVVSIVAAATFVITWEALNDSASIVRQLKALYGKVIRIVSPRWTRANGDALQVFESRLDLDDALLAWDRGKINSGDVWALEQSLCLKEWLGGDDTGWHELWEEVFWGSGLRQAVRLAVERELRRVQQAKSESRSSEYEERLRLLLLSSSEVSKLRSAELVQGKKPPKFFHSEDFVHRIAADQRKQYGAIYLNFVQTGGSMQ